MLRFDALMHPIMHWNRSYLQRITAVHFPVNHIEDLLLHCITGGVAGRPIVRRATSLRAHEEVFRIVNVSVGAVLYTLDDLMRTPWYKPVGQCGTIQMLPYSGF